MKNSPSGITPSATVIKDQNNYGIHRSRLPSAGPACQWSLWKSRQLLGPVTVYALSRDRRTNVARCRYTASASIPRHRRGTASIHPERVFLQYGGQLHPAQQPGLSVPASARSWSHSSPRPGDAWPRLTVQWPFRITPHQDAKRRTAIAMARGRQEIPLPPAEAPPRCWNSPEAATGGGAPGNGIQLRNGSLFGQDRGHKMAHGDQIPCVSDRPRSDVLHYLRPGMNS